MTHRRGTVKPLLLRSDFRQQRNQQAGQSLLIAPTIVVFDIQFVSESHHSAVDVSQVFFCRLEL